MIIDPYGDIIAECRSLANEFQIGDCVYQKIQNSGGFRYKNARRPDLYKAILGQAHESEQNVVWLRKE
jgi:prenyltransferase beta subunit